MGTHSSGVNKVALVTGGSRGIGAAIVRRLAQDGAHVAFTYRTSSDRARALVDEVTGSGGRATAWVTDSADPKAVTAAVERAAAEFGRLDILVNNAGVFVAKPLDAITLEDFEQHLAVNVRAALVAAQAAARHMRDGGRIITIGSSLAERVPQAGLTLYALSKSALLGLTKGLARDLGPRGITVNLVQPGPTDTEMNPADGPYADVQRSYMAIPRYGSPANIAALVAYLASEHGHFATGAVLTVDGGTNA